MRHDGESNDEAASDGDGDDLDGDFHLPDFAAPIDPARLEELLNGVAAEARVKGLFSCAVVDELERARRPHNHLAPPPFSDVPLRDHVRLLFEAAPLLYVDEPVLEGVRRLGRLAYPTFCNTLIGRVIFGVLGGNLPSVLRLAARGFEIACTHVHVDTDVDDARRLATVRAHCPRGVDAYLIGIVEGATRACGAEPSVFIRRGPASLELQLRWEPCAP